MEPTHSSISNKHRCTGVLTIELEPQSSVFIPPAVLTRSDAEELALRFAEDLDHIFEGIKHLDLVVPGALYDQSELLQPGFPLLKTLEEILHGRSGDSPRLMALGSDAGHFPVAAIDPLRRPGSGPLLLLPLVFVGPFDAINTLSTHMEDVLLQTGQVSEATQQSVQQRFALKAVNMSYATVADLCALLKVQLDNSGFASLWTLLEQALFQRSNEQMVMLEEGNRFLWANNQIYTPFYTFDDWARLGPGRELEADRLEVNYGSWVRAQRQYTTTLEAHGLKLQSVLGGAEWEAADVEAILSALPTVLEGDHLVETITVQQTAQEKRLLITHQSLADVGTLAYTVAGLDESDQVLSLAHYYPLHPSGVQTIIDGLIQRCKEKGLERRVLHPGTLVYERNKRCLMGAIAKQSLPLANKEEKIGGS